VIILTVFVTIALFHLIKIIRSIRNIVERIDEGSEVLAEDLHAARTVVSSTSTVLSHLLGFKANLRTMHEDEADDPSPRKKKKKKTKLSIIDEA
jgi:hypothetical protein